MAVSRVCKKKKLKKDHLAVSFKPHWWTTAEQTWPFSRHFLVTEAISYNYVIFEYLTWNAALYVQTFCICFGDAAKGLLWVQNELCVVATIFNRWNVYNILLPFSSHSMQCITLYAIGISCSKLSRPATGFVLFKLITNKFCSSLFSVSLHSYHCYTFQIFCSIILFVVPCSVRLPLHVLFSFGHVSL